jgi:serine/threonine-protein kinase RsbW
MILKLALDIPEDSAYVPITRMLGRNLLEHLKVVPQDIGDAETIVAELCSNVIRHAQSTEGRFQIVLEYYADRVVISVVDEGTGFPFKDLPEIGSERADLNGGTRLGGYGLPLLRALCDRLEFRSTDPHGTTVRAEKYLVYETERDAEDAYILNRESTGRITVST